MIETSRRYTWGSRGHARRIDRGRPSVATLAALLASLGWTTAVAGAVQTAHPPRGPSEAAPGAPFAGDVEQRAPVDVPPWLVDRLDRALEDGIRERITPGAALVVGFGGHVVLTKSWGRLDWDPAAPLVTDSTVYDLASVTKAMATTTAAMRLVELGRLELDAPAASYLEGWPSAGDRGRITVRHLLEHTSGLPGAAFLWRSNRGRREALAAISELRLQGAPGRAQIYSDLGMIVLGLAVEQIAGAPLDQLTHRWVTEPLGLRETAFRPLESGIDPARIAPTELDPGTGTKTTGTVHDANARAMGGVAGHAGLFGSARDLATFAAALLWETPAPIACAATVRRFAHRADPESRFGLGWEMPVPDVIWSDFFTHEAFGHTGFTGTSLWIDPNHDLFVVFLTNRVNPSAQGDEIHDLRRWVHRAIQGWIVDPMSAPAIARAAGDPPAFDPDPLSCAARSEAQLGGRGGA